MKGILWISVPKIGEGMYEKHPHSHVTLQFGVSLTPELEGLMGTEVPIHVTALAWNQRIEAYKVTLPSEIMGMCKNTQPHITVSHIDGAKPVESNEMLSSDHEEIPMNQMVRGVIEFKPF